MYRDKKVVVVMPAYNAAKTVERTYAEVRDQGVVDHIILVDDKSRDETVAVAKKLPTLRIESGVLVAARAINSNVDVALEAGDVIHTMNGALVKTGEELRGALNRTNANNPVVLQIERSGKLMFIAFKLDGTDR